MPWVRLDDRFPSHRKVSLLSDRAFRLYVSALCWSAENLTEGHIPDENLTRIAHVRSTKAAAKELEGRGLWERVHDGWQIHDYLDYNRTRAQVQAERENNAARQQEFRDKKKAAAETAKAKKRAAEEATRNAVTPAVTDDPRNAVSNDAPARPDPVVPPNGGTTTASQAARSGGIPDRLQPLAQALANAGLGAVAWDITKHTDWERIRIQVDRVGIDGLVESALGAANRRGKPDSVTAWIGRWEAIVTAEPLAAEAPGGKVIHLTTGQPLAGTDARVASHYAVKAQMAEAMQQQAKELNR